ncbi:MAG: acylneuraminate cytidylyltransferase family protein [Bacteroidales bacterium]|nr:acylneuraminate cytidylyltransferase family protein [Bacteroidales bacterium]
MKTVAFVPIKLNSQRLPHKNILPIAGHPLCWHIVNSLLKSRGIDEVYVYCSDPRVMDFLPNGVLLKIRDKRLDGNTVKGFEIYSNFINEVDADIYILAHTTSPFIKPASIENALFHIINGENDSAFSAEKIKTFAWYQGKPINYNINDVPRTQDLEPIWKETSAFFMFKKDLFIKHRRRIGFCPYIQEVTGLEAIDIDEKKDYDLAYKLAEIENI